MNFHDDTFAFHRPLVPPPSDALSALPMTLIDEIECGLIVCDAQGTVRLTNRAAKRELADGRALCLAGEHLLRPHGENADLDAAIRQAALRGRRTLLQTGGAAGRLLVSVQPLSMFGLGDPLVLLLLGRRQPCSDLGLELLASRFGLTLAERRVLAGLLRDASPREIALDHAVALSTVRTQISSIRAKLGARSIDHLLLRAAEVPPVANALHSDYARAPSASTAALRRAA